MAAPGSDVKMAGLGAHVHPLAPVGRARQAAIGLGERLAPLRQRLARWLSQHGDRVLPLLAALLIVGSLPFAYWHLELHAPQYPRGLNVRIWVDHVEGDIKEIDGLNHYIGMAPLDEGGELERRISLFAIPLVAAAGALAAIRRRRFWLFALPAIALPAIFVGDLFFWLYKFGHELDPTAALSSSIGEFTPMLLGPGRVAQFRTTSSFGPGFYLALLGAILLITAVVARLRRERGAASG